MTAQHPGLPPSGDPPATRGLRIGQKVGGGRFALVEALGEGGMGVVWKAVDSTLGGMVALKFLPLEISADPTAIEDLRRETAQTRRLSHPNIVRVYDLYEDISPFIYMEFVEGQTLSHERVRHPRHVLPWRYLAPYAAQLCDGLDYAHREHVVHRDLKPSNVLIDTLRDQVKLVDFGIARAVAESVTRVTQKRPPDGTLVYMSCQQLNGEQATALDDIYSLGVTFYELLTSKPPFHSGDTAWQIRYGEVAPVTERLAEFQLENEVPHHVEEAIMACLARDPFKRPQSVRDVAALLGLLEPHSGSRRRTNGTHPTPRAPRGVRPPYRGAAVPASPADTAAHGANEPGDTGTPQTTRRITPRHPTVGTAECTPDSAPRSRGGVRTDLPPASLPEPARRPAPRRASRILAWMIVVLGLAAVLYFIRVSPRLFGGPSAPSSTNTIRLYEALLSRLEWLTSTITSPPAPAGAKPSSAGTGTEGTRPPAPADSAAIASAPALGESTETAAAQPAPSNTIELASAKPLVATGPGTTPVPVANAPPAVSLTSSAPDTPHYPTTGRSWTNSLGMRFAPVEGTRTLFGVWETRRADYDAFLQASPSHRVYGVRAPPFAQNHPHEPVVKVSWSNAVAFCRWLTEAELEKGLLNQGQSYRLPTDREWSFAVGLTNETGRTLNERITSSRFTELYPWGSAWPPPKGAGNFRGTETRFPTAIPRYDDGAVFTAVVGRHGTNRLGLADLGGNVWEWCLQEPGEALRVARGGAWDTSDPRELRSAHRYTLTPGTELESLGFRCVIDLGEDR